MADSTIQNPHDGFFKDEQLRGQAFMQAALLLLKYIFRPELSSEIDAELSLAGCAERAGSVAGMCAVAVGLRDSGNRSRRSGNVTSGPEAKLAESRRGIDESY